MTNLKKGQHHQFRQSPGDGGATVSRVVVNSKKWLKIQTLDQATVPVNMGRITYR
jgi:hypothetical protein